MSRTIRCNGVGLVVTIDGVELVSPEMQRLTSFLKEQQSKERKLYELAKQSSGMDSAGACLAMGAHNAFQWLLVLIKEGFFDEKN